MSHWPLSRWRLSRRRLLGSVVATACAGCAGRDAGSSQTAPSPTTGPRRSILPGVIDLGPLDEVLAAVEPSSGWFECGCHGSRCTTFGEHRDGPGPRGMDAFALATNDDGRLVAEANRIATGLPVGGVVVDLAPVGPHCVEGTASH